MKILVTGANGFVGQAIEAALKNTKYTFVAGVRPEKSSLFKNHPVVVLEGNNYQGKLAGVDVVIHLAALVHRPHITDMQKYKDVNEQLSLDLAESAIAAGVNKFIFMSTCSVYGACNKRHCENESLELDSPYAISKYSAEKKLEEVFGNVNNELYILRPPLIYGKSAKGKLRGLLKLIKQSPFHPFGRASEKRSYVSVGNLISFIFFLIENECEQGVYNVSDGNDLSTRQLIKCMNIALKNRCLAIKVPKLLMRLLFIVVGKPGFYKKIYKPFRLDIRKALSTGWIPRKPQANEFRVD